jgi:hypothetical protein
VPPVTATLILILMSAGATDTAPEPSEVRRYIQAAAVLFASLDNQGALEKLAQAKAVPHAVEDDVLISLYEGLITSDEGHTADSEAAFRAAFALDPNAPLPIRVSPKLEAWIERVRQEVKRRLVHAQLVPAAPQQPKPVEAAPPAAVELPPPAEAPRRAWIPAAAVGAALLAGAVVCAVLEMSIERRLNAGDTTITTLAQLDDVYSQGRAFTVAGITLGAAAAAAAVVAAVLFAWNPGASEP